MLIILLILMFVVFGAQIYFVRITLQGIFREIRLIEQIARRMERVQTSKR